MLAASRIRPTTTVRARVGESFTALVRKVLLLSFPSFVLMLLLAEICLRVLGYTPYYLNGQAFIPSRDKEVIYELRPGFTGLYASVPMRVNSQGFRGPELSAKPQFRVLIVGDSIAFGQGVAEGQTLADQLTVLLGSRLHTAVEVVNLGVPGYNSCQEYAMVRDRGVPLAPQAAVLIYVDNDTYAAGNGIRFEGDRLLTPDIRSGPVGDFMAWFRKSSRAYNLLWSHWQVVKAPSATTDEYRRLLAKRFDDSDPGWRASRTCVTEIAELARARAIRLIVIPFPEARGLHLKPYPFQFYVEAVCDAARSAGAECLDVVPLLQRPGLKLWVSAVERHPAPDVYGIIAEQLQERLAETAPRSPAKEHLE